MLRIAHFGFGRTCDICGSRTRRWLDQGYPNPTLYKLQIIGGLPKRGDECPVCRSNSRIRLVMLYLRRHTKIFESACDILHMAPERGLSMKLSPILGDRYVCADLEPERYLEIHPLQKADLCALEYAENSFDFVLCNHVLEHVPDDRLAMSEILRVLRPGGTAILQVPISRKLEATLEGKHAPTDEDRTRIYGQHDHVRLYKEDDYVARLRAVGFDVDPWAAYERDGDAAYQAEIDPFETLFVCRKPD
ncbi:MAG: methyltransferase domain-containing protein [Pseudomonadota bacterium]